MLRGLPAKFCGRIAQRFRITLIERLFCCGLLQPDILAKYSGSMLRLEKQQHRSVSPAKGEQRIETGRLGDDGQTA